MEAIEARPILIVVMVAIGMSVAIRTPIMTKIGVALRCDKMSRGRGQQW